MLTPEKEPSFALLALHPPGCDENSETYNPMDVFAQLFSYYYLDTLRRDLWEMFKMANRNSDLGEVFEKRDRFIFTYEMLHDILTAAYVRLTKQSNENLIPLVP